jgi:hypothetical protein
VAQNDWPEVLKFPRGHWVQFTAPLDAKEPASQGLPRKVKGKFGSVKNNTSQLWINRLPASGSASFSYGM